MTDKYFSIRNFEIYMCCLGQNCLDAIANCYAPKYWPFLFLFQVDFTLMMLAMWVKAARDVQMVPLLHLIRHQELENQIASLVHKVKRLRTCYLGILLFFNLRPVKFKQFQHSVQHAFNTLFNQMLGAFEQVVQHC